MIFEQGEPAYRLPFLRFRVKRDVVNGLLLAPYDDIEDEVAICERRKIVYCKTVVSGSYYMCIVQVARMRWTLGAVQRDVAYKRMHIAAGIVVGKNVRIDIIDSVFFC